MYKYNMALQNKHLGLFTDHYELTMAQGYFLDGRENFTANFDYFFRKNPFGSGYTIFAGLQDLLEMIQNLIWATDYNVFAIPLAAGVLYSAGIVLSPALGAVLMSLSTIIVAINSRLLKA